MLSDPPTAVNAAKHFGLFAGFIGLCTGIAYGIGGLFVDLFTTGLNVGTALALNAIWAMPFLFAPIGVLGGLLWLPIYRRVPASWGGGRHPNL